MQGTTGMSDLSREEFRLIESYRRMDLDDQRRAVEAIERILKETHVLQKLACGVVQTLFLAAMFCSAAFGQFQIETPERIAKFKRLLPKVESSELRNLLNDSATLWYTSQTIVPAHQLVRGNGSGAETRFSRVDYNVSADFPESQKPDGSGGNANVDFPWAEPGGTHRSPGVSSIKFMRLPRREGGGRWPIVWFRQRFSRWRIQSAGSLRGYGWTYPAGTTFGEVLVQRTPSGHGRTFEIRTRTRTPERWTFAIYRPYRTSEELIAKIRELRPVRTQTLNTALVAMAVGPAEKLRLTDDNRDEHGFDVSTWVDTLPDLHDDKLVDQLLSEPFKESFGEHWKGDGVLAPTTNADYHIVPKNYDGNFAAENCMNCHDSVGLNARDFDRRRGWYGMVRGSDGILSMHPVATSAIGFGTTQAVRMRQAFIDAGILEKFDPTTHPNKVYTKLPNLK